MPASASASALAFDYVFTPSPNPIRASVGGANPSVIDLQVMISPGDAVRTVRSLTITIPIGDEAENSLSAATTLPQPTFADSAEWSVTVEGEDLVVRPALGASGKLLGSLLITLPRIVVNSAAGVVHLEIDEITSAGQATDNTMRLVKHPADTPVSAFWAEPAVVYDLDQQVTLRWTCTDQGKRVVYAVSGDSSSADCLQGGDCLDCADGARGIQPTPPSSTTTYTLDVIGTDPDGSRVITDTLTTTVQVQLPNVLPDVRREQLAVEHLVRLHWLALGAARCSLELEGDTFADPVPLDTYSDGYLVHLPVSPGTYTMSVTAHAATGNAAPFQEFQPVTMHGVSTTIEVAPGAIGMELVGLALTADGKYALVCDGGGSLIFVVNLQTQATEGRQILTGTGAITVAVSPDGRSGLVGQWGESDVAFFDVAARALVGPRIKTTGMPFALAITPNGALGLVCDSAGLVRFLDMAQRKEKFAPLKVGGAPGSVAITPDGALALVTVAEQEQVVVVRLSGTPAIDSRISIPDQPAAVALTQDGKKAVVASAGAVTLVDVASRKPGRSFPVPSKPTYVAVTPDASLALATGIGSGDLTVVDLRAGGVSTLPIGAGLRTVLMHPDGKRVVTIDVSGGKVYLI